MSLTGCGADRRQRGVYRREAGSAGAAVRRCLDVVPGAAAADDHVDRGAGAAAGDRDSGGSRSGLTASASRQVRKGTRGGRASGRRFLLLRGADVRIQNGAVQARVVGRFQDQALLGGHQRQHLFGPGVGGVGQIAGREAEQGRAALVGGGPRQSAVGDCLGEDDTVARLAGDLLDEFAIRVAAAQGGGAGEVALVAAGDQAQAAVAGVDVGELVGVMPNQRPNILFVICDEPR